MYDWLRYTSKGVGYSLCHGVGKLGSIMTQWLKFANEQAEGYSKIMEVKEAKQQLLILKNPLNINYRSLTDLHVKYFVSGKKIMKMLC